MGLLDFEWWDNFLHSNFIYKKCRPREKDVKVISYSPFSFNFTVICYYQIKKIEENNLFENYISMHINTHSFLFQMWFS